MNRETTTQEHPVTVTLSLPRVPAVLALALMVSACAGPQSRNPFDGPAGSGRGSIQVRVENQNFGDVTVHAIRGGGERIRLGQVTGKSEKSFTMQWNFPLPLKFEVNVVGGQGCGVRPINVDPGDKIWVRVPPQIGVTPCYSGKG